MTKTEAREADDFLRCTLAPTGVRLKDDFEKAFHDMQTRPVKWLGFDFKLSDDDWVEIRLGDRPFEKLKQGLLRAHAKPDSCERANCVLRNWLSQRGHCYHWEEPKEICREMLKIAADLGYEEVLSRRELLYIWEDAQSRWYETKRKMKRKREDYLVRGPVKLPSPHSFAHASQSKCGLE